MTSLPFARIRAWLFEAALPLWAERGVDRVHGGFVEGLNLDGGPALSPFKRVRVAARQTYVFAHAASLGWAPGRDLSRQGAVHLDNLYQGPARGWPRRLAPDNAILDPTPDLYDLAFILFAYAWRGRIDADARAGAERALDFIEAHMRAPTGGFWPSLPTGAHQLQNPHMHLLEACLAAFETYKAPRFLDLARELVRLFKTKFFDGRTLCEIFAPDWARAPGEAGRIIEPGHHFEWVWILAQYARLTGVDMRDEIVRLIEFAERYGVDPEMGMTVQSVRDDGAPLDSSSRIWPNTERIKAHLALYETTGADPRAAVAQSANLLLNVYLAAPTPGLWIDHLIAGAPAPGPAPASSFYHLFLAFSEVLRLERALS